MTELNNISGHWRGEILGIKGECSLRLSEQSNGNLIGTFMNMDREPVSDVTGRFHIPTVIISFKFQTLDIRLEGKLDETNNRMEGIAIGFPGVEVDFFFVRTA
jgi:hypothetical protein